MMKTLKRIVCTLLVAVFLIGVVPATNADAALSKPKNFDFVRWNNTSFTSCRMSWKSVPGANVYAIIWELTDGSKRKVDATQNTYYDITGLQSNHVYQAYVQAFYYDSYYDEILSHSAYSAKYYITPLPKSVSASLVDKKKTNVKLKWNPIYGCNGYNVWLTTNPYGTWYWNQSTAIRTLATSATIKKYRGSKLKTYTNYYYRIVTRRKRNGSFCTVVIPSSYYSQGGFRISYK